VSAGRRQVLRPRLRVRRRGPLGRREFVIAYRARMRPGAGARGAIRGAIAASCPGQHREARFVDRVDRRRREATARGAPRHRRPAPIARCTARRSGDATALCLEEDPPDAQDADAPSTPRTPPESSRRVGARSLPDRLPQVATYEIRRAARRSRCAAELLDDEIVLLDHGRRPRGHAVLDRASPHVRQRASVCHPTRSR